MSSALSLLEPEYPGISRIDFHCSAQFVEKLKKLTTKINYALPKSFYSDEIGEFQTELEEAYYTFLDSDFRMTEDMEVPWEFIRKARAPSDEEEALAPVV